MYRSNFASALLAASVTVSAIVTATEVRRIASSLSRVSIGANLIMKLIIARKYGHIFGNIALIMTIFVLVGAKMHYNGLIQCSLTIMIKN
jgi:hypothetical protein